MGRAPGQRDEAPPLKLNTFCVVICLKWHKAAMFISCFMVINGQHVYIHNAAFIHGLWRRHIAHCPTPFVRPCADVIHKNVSATYLSLPSLLPLLPPHPLTVSYTHLTLPTILRV